MTREEAIFCEKSYLGETNCTDCKYYGTDTCESRETHKMSIKALERESSDDCVSRQAIDQNIYDYAESNGLSYTNMKNYILDVPHVTPTRKKGKWIKRESATGLEQYYQCSNCRNHCLYEYVEIGFQNAKTKYCPNCGTEMENVENDK
jgi:NADH pyrophosphatase NudC (nudix superfamily)